VAGLLAFVFFRVLAELVGVFAAYRAAAPSRIADHPGDALSIWNQWDVGWFSNLARQGYLALGRVPSPGPS